MKLSNTLKPIIFFFIFTSFALSLNKRLCKLPKPVNIKDISRESKVSVSTVSRVLNGLSAEFRISEETTALVKKIAKKLNYHPNQTAVNLRLRKTNTIGLIIPSLSNPFFSNLASRFIQELRKHGYSVILTDSNEQEEKEAEDLNMLAQRSIDGLIIVPSGMKGEEAEALFKKGTPVICIDRYYDSSGIPYVATNNYLGAYELTSYLIAQGHQRIACIQGAEHVVPNIQRVKGYVDALKEKGLPVYHIGGNDFTEENGYLEMKLLLQSNEKPTAVFALSDTILLGTLKALKEERLRVPDDISIVTFDNSVYLDYFAPAITGVIQPVNEIATLAVKILLDRLKGKSKEGSGKQEKILITPKIIHRESVRRLN